VPTVSARRCPLLGSTSPSLWSEARAASARPSRPGRSRMPVSRSTRGRARDGRLSVDRQSVPGPQRAAAYPRRALRLGGDGQRRPRVHPQEPYPNGRSRRAERARRTGNRLRASPRSAPPTPCAGALEVARPRGGREDLRVVAGRRRARGLPAQLSALYTPVGPGLWVPTPPTFSPALQPFWGRTGRLPSPTFGPPRPATIRPTRRRRGPGSGRRPRRSTRR
jgi:hypothetical protein